LKGSNPTRTMHGIETSVDVISWAYIHLGERCTASIYASVEDGNFDIV
jgi:hypothetical protein